MSDQSHTFLVRYLSGEAGLHEIDEYVARWHDGDGAELSLADYLGFSSEEYALWVERPKEFQQLLLARTAHGAVVG